MTDRRTDVSSGLGSSLNSLRGQRLLVTGASGFIGGRLCRRAVEQGATVHAISRHHRATGASDEVRWERADVTDHSAVDSIFRRLQPDIVVHLAGEVSGARERDLVLPMLRANLLSAVNVMLASSDAGCRRLVLAGSLEEPDLGDPEGVAHSPYAASKSGALTYARFFHALYGLPVVHLRIFMVYGPGQRDMHKLVPYVATSLLRGRSPKLTSASRPVDWIYVDDVVDAFLRAALAPGVEGGSLDVGSGEALTVREIVTRMTDLIDGDAEPEFGAIADRKLERVRIADPTKAADAIGWRPSIPLSEGLERTVDYYRSQLDRLTAS